MRTAVCNSSSELFAEMVMAQSSGLQLFPILFRETVFESLPEGNLDSCFACKLDDLCLMCRTTVHAGEILRLEHLASLYA